MTNRIKAVTIQGDSERSKRTTEVRTIKVHDTKIVRNLVLFLNEVSEVYLPRVGNEA